MARARHPLALFEVAYRAPAANVNHRPGFWSILKRRLTGYQPSTSTPNHPSLQLHAPGSPRTPHPDPQPPITPAPITTAKTTTIAPQSTPPQTSTQTPTPSPTDTPAPKKSISIFDLDHARLSLHTKSPETPAPAQPLARSTPTPTQSAPTPTIAPPTPAPLSITLPETQQDSETPATTAPITTPAPERSEGLQFLFDPDRREIVLRVSYVSAIILATALIALIVMAYLLGSTRRTAATHLVLASESTKDVKNDPITPVKNDTTPDPDEDASSAPPAAPPQPATPTAYANSQNTPNNATLITNSQLNPRSRTVNLYYVQVQTFRQSSPADNLAAIMNKQGIPCTVERGIVDPQEYSVITLLGFAKRSDPLFKSYESKVATILKSQPGMMTPSSIKWQPNMGD